MVLFDKLRAGSHPAADGPLKRLAFLAIARFSHGKASRDLETGRQRLLAPKGSLSLL